MLTEIAFVLDETGSMGMIRDDTIGSFNNFIEEQKEEEGEAVLTLVQFSKIADEDTYRTVHRKVPLEDVEPLTQATYRPRGCTPLLDAIGSTIDRVDGEADLTIVVVLTDGRENASEEYTLEQVKAKIEEKKEEGWGVMFLGANMDAVAVGRSMNIDVNVNFEATTEGVRYAHGAASRTVSMARKSGGWGDSQTDGSP